MTTPTLIHIEAKSRRLDRDIDLCRFGAKKHRATVILQRTTTSPNGHQRVHELLEFSPTGDISECPAPRMRTTIGAIFAHKYVRRNTPAHDRMAAIVERTAQVIAADDAKRDAAYRKDKQARRQQVAS